MNMKPFAAFILVFTSESYVAATTRAIDCGEADKIGLPGGKIDTGETPRDAAIREAEEEGWLVKGVSVEPIHSDIVDGKLVLWFSARSAIQLTEYKEKGRITPIRVYVDDIKESGYGNENLPFDLALDEHKAWLNYLDNVDITEYD